MVLLLNRLRGAAKCRIIVPSRPRSKHAIMPTYRSPTTDPKKPYSCTLRNKERRKKRKKTGKNSPLCHLETFGLVGNPQPAWYSLAQGLHESRPGLTAANVPPFLMIDPNKLCHFGPQRTAVS